MIWRSLLDDLRRQVLTGLGVAPSLLLLACSGSGDQSQAGVTTDPSGDGSSVDDDTSDSGVPATTAPNTDEDESDTEDPETDDESDPDTEDSGDGDGDPIKLDLPAGPDLPAPRDCTTTIVPPSTLDEHPDCSMTLDDCTDLVLGCVALEPGETCEQICPDGDCVIEWSTCAGDPVWDMPGTVCGPYEINGQCCSLADSFNGCGTDGRPFVVAGVSRQAVVLARGECSLDIDTQLPGHVREHLARHWEAIAKAEHASVASFAQFGARLLALAAPPELVRETLTAASDEVRHAELALARASELAGRPLEFGPLDTRDAARPGESFEETVLACVREGCIGETLAALELGAAALACEDAELSSALRAIAADESRHAALAWRFVAWALTQAPSLAPSVAAVFDALVLDDEISERFDERERELLRMHGCLPADERRLVQLDGLRELLRPCAAALLGSQRAAQPMW